MIAATAITGIHWKTVQVPHSCHECGAPILPGDRMAAWTEVTVHSWGNHPTHDHIHRVYCVECGHLLEDSLTTTENV
jgi:hypothetical protein